MTADHPDELLAEYVDGALGPDARGRIDAHLDGCARCRREVALAREARERLAALPELPAPADLDLAVRRRRPAAPSRAWRVVAPVAAAAVLVAGGIVVLSQLEGTEERGVAGGGGGGGAPLAPEPSPEAAGSEAGDRTLAQAAPGPRYSESSTDYGRADLSTLARGLRDDAREALGGGLAPTATAFYGAFDPSTLPPRLRDVYRCVVADVPPEQLIVPFTIEAASFEGEPAYVASFLQGPAPDQPYDRILIWVVGRQDCKLRSLAAQRL
jgi:putative zinc finger protein